jgi:hypothetical protein
MEVSGQRTKLAESISMLTSGAEYIHGDDATNIAEVSLFFDFDDTKFLRTFPKRPVASRA